MALVMRGSASSSSPYQKQEKRGWQKEKTNYSILNSHRFTKSATKTANPQTHNANEALVGQCCFQRFRT